MANNNNLRPFHKGVSGNPKGRPKVIPELKDVLVKIMTDKRKGRTALEAIFISLRNRAIKGDIRAIQEILDRIYGKTKHVIESNNIHSNEITFSGLPKYAENENGILTFAGKPILRETMEKLKENQKRYDQDEQNQNKL